MDAIDRGFASGTRLCCTKWLHTFAFFCGAAPPGDASSRFRAFLSVLFARGGAVSASGVTAMPFSASMRCRCGCVWPAAPSSPSLPDTPSSAESPASRMGMSKSSPPSASAQALSKLLLLLLCKRSQGPCRLGQATSFGQVHANSSCAWHQSERG